MIERHKEEIKIIIFLLISTLIFVLIYKFIESSIKLPYENEFLPISMDKLEQQLKDDEIEKIYFSTVNQDIYIITRNNELESIVNNRTEEFYKKLYNSNAKIEDTTKLKFKSHLLGARICIPVVVLCYIYFWCIGELIKIRSKKKKDTGTSFVVNNKRPNKQKQTLAKSSTTSDTGGSRQGGIEADSYEALVGNIKTFNDIAGLKEVKKDMKCIVDFLVNRDKYTAAGAKLPKGVILYGPPGTGKTLLAKAVATEADVPFLYMSGSEFIEMYVGVGAKRVRELFNEAREQAPCIVFIDEIDTIGSKRTGHDNDESRKTINQLLTEMDGFNSSDNIIVIGATNRLDDLDPALTRPGRFTNKFCVPLPETADERLEVINIYTKNKRLAEDIDLEALAKETVGFSPAKIEALLNEAAIIAVQNDRVYITKSDIDNAMIKLLLSGHIKEGQDKRDKKELEIVAWHEAGHALLGKLFNREITKVTILASTSGAGGVTFSVPKTGLLSKKDIKQEIMELYGGRIGELLYFNGDDNEVTTGASNDIERATQLIHSYIVDYGMNNEIGMLSLSNGQGFGDKTDDYIRQHEINMAKELEEETKQLLTKNKDKLNKIASLLLEKETIYDKDLDNILR